MAAATFTRRELYELVWSTPMTTAARQLGISANGLAKICDRLLVPYPTRGHWTRAAEERPKPAPLPKSRDLDAIPIVIGQTASRRTRSRLSPEARRAQLLDAALTIVAEEGINAVSLRRVAREIGVSEALAFRYFSSRGALLAELGRRELAALSAYQREQIARGDSRRSRVALSTSSYLRFIEERGGVLHILLSAPEVRTLLRKERRASQARRGANVAGDLATTYSVAPDIAHGAVQALTALSRRAGRLLALGKISRADAERLSITMIEQANRDVVAAASPSAPRARRVRRADS